MNLRPFIHAFFLFLGLCGVWTGASSSGRINLEGSNSEPAGTPFQPSTSIKIDQGLWMLNGKVTYPGTRAEGLLLNVRMVNAVFEDRNPDTCPKGFDPDRNTEAFLQKISEYVSLGVRAFTLCLQGGPPGYAGALNSAYQGDGSLRPEYRKRVERVIEACDREGAVVILSCFDEEQDQVLREAGAVKAAVKNTAGWIRERGYTNVLLEIANEFANPGFDHKQIQASEGIRELIRLAKETCPGLLVSASGGSGGRIPHMISIESDFLLLHFGKVPVQKILERVASADKVSKAIVCNGDSKIGEVGARALEATVNALASWGYSNQKQNQEYPFKFEGKADDPVVYAKFQELTTPAK